MVRYNLMKRCLILILDQKYLRVLILKLQIANNFSENFGKKIIKNLYN